MRRKLMILWHWWRTISILVACGGNMNATEICNDAQLQRRMQPKVMQEKTRMLQA